jgi:hypothetical protein
LALSKKLLGHFLAAIGNSGSFTTIRRTPRFWSSSNVLGYSPNFAKPLLWIVMTVLFLLPLLVLVYVVIAQM